MLGNVTTIVLRICLIAAFWGFVWGFVEARTQSMRVVRAALLLLGLFVIWAVLTVTAG